MEFFDPMRNIGYIGALCAQDTWDNDGKVAVDRTEWSKLTPVQKRAAQALSIDKELWDSELFVDIYERSWSELTTGSTPPKKKRNALLASHPAHVIIRR